MTLLLRAIQSGLKALRQEKLSSLGDEIRLDFRVLPIDLDVYLHMNNAKFLCYFEAARWSSQIRTGFLKTALKRKWIAPVAKIEVVYLKPLRAWQKFTVTMRIVKLDEKWIYIAHEMWSRDKLVAKALVRLTIRSREGNVPPSVYLPALGYASDAVTTPERFRQWIADFERSGVIPGKSP